MIRSCLPTPPHVLLFRALWSLLDGIWGLLKGSWGVLFECDLRSAIRSPSRSPLESLRFPLKGSFKGNIGIDIDGCQNFGPFLEVHIKGDVDIAAEIDTDS